MMKHGKILALIVLLVLLLALLTACAPGDGANTPENPAGFFTGVWHGWIAPITVTGHIICHEREKTGTTAITRDGGRKPLYHGQFRKTQ